MPTAMPSSLNSPSQPPSNGASMLDASSFSSNQPPQGGQHDISQPQSQRPAQPRPSVSSLLSAGTGNVLTNKAKSNLPGVERVSTSYSMSSRQTRNSTSTRAENIAPNRAVRTLPPWIDSYEPSESDHAPSRATDRLLAPSLVHSATHHFGSTPTVAGPATPPQNKRVSQDGWIDDDDAEASTLPAERTPERNIFGTLQKTEKGRKWDHARSGAPIILEADNGRSSWIPFIKSSMYGPAPNEEGKRVDPEFLKELTPGYEKPWIGDLEGGDAENALGLLHKKGRRVWYKRLQHLLLTHPLVPLAFRVTTLITSIIALALSSSIFRHSNRSKTPENASALMAIVVDVVAMLYICWITWDEYTGKPLGLRSLMTKMGLVLLDLFFIIFESANATLAFNALPDDRGACKTTTEAEDKGLCGSQTALGAILLIALVAWVLTFGVSIFRLVQRVGGREEEDDD